MPTPRFPLGQVFITPGAARALEHTRESIWQYIGRHAKMDWGEVTPGDAQLNDQAVVSGGRLLSAYRLGDGTFLWVITEADRSATTALLPEEY